MAHVKLKVDDVIDMAQATIDSIETKFKAKYEDEIATIRDKPIGFFNRRKPTRLEAEKIFKDGDGIWSNYDLMVWRKMERLYIPENILNAAKNAKALGITEMTLTGDELNAIG
jgi:hypothetical protein